MINYDKYAKKYDTRYTSTMCIQENLSISKALNDIQNLKTKRIIDFGCGTGFLLDILGKSINFDNYLGIDISKEMIGFAKAKYPNASFILGDSKNVEAYITLFDFKPDLAISLFTIPYIGVATIKAAYSILPKEGQFLMVYYNKPYINPSSVYAKKRGYYEFNIKPKVNECIICAEKLFKKEYMHFLTDTDAYNIALFKKV